MVSRRLLLLLFYNWNIACIFLTAVNAANPNCDVLPERLELTNSADVCVIGNPALGHSFKPATLDFSKAEKGAFDLLKKGFTDFNGAFVMDGNEKVETLDFGQIVTFNGNKLLPDSSLISIRNNPNLKELKWDASVTQLYIFPDKKLHIRINNNPQLNMASLNMITEAVKSKSNFIVAIQLISGECKFEYRSNESDYFLPTADILPHCKIISSDFKMNGGNLTNVSLWLTVDKCLQLVNVDMENATLALAAGKLNSKCADGSESMISNNTKLCGEDLAKLEDLFDAADNIKIEWDKASCTIDCTPQQKGHKYNICKEEKEESTTIDSNSGGGGDNGNNGNNINGNNGNTTSNNNNQNNNNPPWLAIGIGLGIGGGLLLIVSIILIVLWKKRLLPCFKKSKKRKKHKKKGEEDEMQTVIAPRTDADYGNLAEFECGLDEIIKNNQFFVKSISEMSMDDLQKKYESIGKIKLPTAEGKPPAGEIPPGIPRGIRRGPVIGKAGEPWKLSNGMELGSLITFDSQEFYICGKQKDKKTTAAFWQAVHDNMTRYMVMIGNCWQIDQEYIPLRKNAIVDLDTVQLTCVKSLDQAPCVERKTVQIQLMVEGKSSEWNVWVEYFTYWPNDSFPYMDDGPNLFVLVENMIGRIDKDRLSGRPSPPDKDGRYLVMCQDGKLRTGILFLLYLAWIEVYNSREYKEPKLYDIAAMVVQLRTLIPSAISDFRQFLFVYVVLMKEIIYVNKQQRGKTIEYRKEFFTEAEVILYGKKEADTKQKPSEQTSKADSKQKPSEKTTSKTQ